MIAAARVILAILGVMLIAVGLLVIAVGQLLSGLYALVVGAVLIVALLYERGRYRSIDADVHNDAPGPGGGEPPGVMPPGFRPTDEVFIDPSSGRRMRVYLQAATGNRRYMAED
jgi:hypothetical protein